MATIILKLDRIRITFPKGSHIFPKMRRLHLKFVSYRFQPTKFVNLDGSLDELAIAREFMVKTVGFLSFFFSFFYYRL
jgi:hypothetical protein